MNEEKASSDRGPQTSKPKSPARAEQKKASRTRRPGRGAAVAAALALLVALLGVGASGSLWYLLRVQEGVLGARLPQRIEGLEERLAALEKTAAEQRERLTALGERQQAHAESIERVIAELGRDRDAVALEEVRQLLLLANHRLELARDIDTSVAALRAADARLERLADPALLEVRRKIAEEITALETAERVDVPGLALRLAALARSAATLPLLRQPEPPAEAPAAPPAIENRGWRALAREVRDDLLSLVRVRRIEATGPPLLPPKYEYFLRENLRLQLEGAQLALLANAPELFGARLAEARAWIERYFDTEAEAVRAALSEIERMAKLDLAPPLPTPSGSLAALEKLQQAAGRGR